MAKLRHIAIAAKDPDAMAEFYKRAFDFKEVRKTVSVTNEIAAQITILLERADGNNQ